jgi:hypothetical protein
MKLPPYLTTNVSPLNFWMYGSASSSVVGFGDQILHAVFLARSPGE